MSKKIILIIICFFVIINNVDASSMCSYEEERRIEQEAANVKITYEPIEEIEELSDGIIINKKIKVSIYNLNENLYLNLKNDKKDNETCPNCETTITYADTVDGVASFDWTEIGDIANFVVNVYSSTNTNCPDEKYKTLYLTIPRINEYAKLAVCDEFKDFYLCQDYVTFEEISKDNFFNQLDKYQNKTINENGKEIKTTFGDKLFKFINDNKYIIIGIFAVVGCSSFIIYTTTSKKQKEIGL